jgi:hypothetical protein
VESFISFNEKNINEYYIKEILQEKTDSEKETAEILKDAAELHEDLRNYGNLKDIDKPLVVSGILLALTVDKNNEPDYRYMEEYIKNLMFQKYQSYLEYYNKQK